MKMYTCALLILFFSLLSFQKVLAEAGFLPKNCQFNKECLQELPGAVCGDGTASYFTVTVRPKAKNLLVFLQGGGACWDYASCVGGFAKNLTRIEPNNDWNSGGGIQNAAQTSNPFREDTVVTVPYCTGDAFSGSRDAEYESNGSKKKVRHQGYKNVTLTLEAIQKLYPEAERVALVGESAGGMGVLFHVRNLVKTFPKSNLFALSDCGVPFKPPYLDAKAYDGVMKAWGAVLDGTAKNLSELGEENAKLFPEVRFGLIASYFDGIMTFFARSVGSPNSLKAVKQTLIEFSDKHLGLDRANQKVFYIDSVKHTFLKQDLKGLESEGKALSDWMKNMLDRKDLTWENIRPDLHRELQGDLPQS